MDLENIELNDNLTIDIYKSEKRTENYFIVCHGFGGNKIEYNQYEQMFNILINQYNIVTFNFTGCDSIDYKILNIQTIDTWLSDLEQIVTYIKNRETVARIALCGISMGGWITTLFSLKNDYIYTNICIGAVLSLNMSIRTSKGILYQYLKEDVPSLNNISVNKNFLYSLMVNQPYIEILNGEYKVPTLILVGEMDNIFRKTDADILEDLIGNCGKSVEKHMIRNGKHFINNYGAINMLTDCIMHWLYKLEKETLMK